MKRFYIFLFLCVLISCKTQKEYIRVPMSPPPQKYFMLDYNSQNTFELEHINALKQYGKCEIHRDSFIKNFVGKNDEQ